ncbi:MAG TPA: hypothetical protein VFA06_03085 [Actinocrinis sp.]|uniref:hypothetical protein n=1 Tax=Actinocrinis sp. TaxID=1920516 RepID=UPI002D54C4FD|nr:hypothetical protein [Actinocrinis sp.]HZU54833.1 hypothetical protein [Actinocrinis sp.]
MPTTSTPRTRPPDGFYSVWDAARCKLTHWHVTDRGRGLAPFPSGAKYGPPKPGYDPDLDPEVRREAMRRWREDRDAFLALVVASIAADPDAAGRAFVRWTGRCQSCRAALKVEDLQPDAEPEQSSDRASHSPAAALLAAAVAGRTVDVRVLLGDADPAEVIAQLAETIAVLAPLTGGRA